MLCEHLDLFSVRVVYIVASFLFNIFLCVIHRYFTRKLHNMCVNFTTCVCNNIGCLCMCFIFYN